jgi:hypothetical protein
LLVSGAVWYSQGVSKEGSGWSQSEKAVQKDEMDGKGIEELEKEVSVGEADTKVSEGKVTEDSLQAVSGEASKAFEALEVQGDGASRVSAGEGEVIEKYEPQFLALRDEYSGKINALAGAAKAEYKQLPSDQRQEAALLLGAKYLEKGNALESECDARFHTILSQMQRELEAEGLPLTEVQTVMQTYESQKNARREALLNEAMGSDE